MADGCDHTRIWFTAARCSVCARSRRSHGRVDDRAGHAGRRDWRLDARRDRVPPAPDRRGSPQRPRPAVRAMRTSENLDTRALSRTSWTICTRQSASPCPRTRRTRLRSRPRRERARRGDQAGCGNTQRDRLGQGPHPAAHHLGLHGRPPREVLRPLGRDTSRDRKDPLVLWFHDQSNVVAVIGKSFDVSPTETTVEAVTQFATTASASRSGTSTRPPCSPRGPWASSRSRRRPRKSPGQRGA